ncbi:hypothetical protein [Hyalangium gracile]|uniref:hypothetical protein n=1 Tax=Hyalangium gracile TaxID=394092 RepID=UPI001CC998C9|nr:hypothetical protein [Hyalangium gracile]
MKKLSLVALLVALSACKSDKYERDAIQARVVLDPTVQASCVLLEVRDPANPASTVKDWVPRKGKNELKVAIFKGSLPTDVEIAARPYQDGDCENDTEARTPNGAFVTVRASFVEGAVTEAPALSLTPGRDTDNDRYVSAEDGGADCQDSIQSVNPGVVEQCTDQEDFNCDNKRGCEATQCGTNACFRPPTNLALTLQETTVAAGSCTRGTVQVKDASGNDSRVTTPTAVNLASNPAGSIAFYTDAACTASTSSTTIAAQEGTASFYFQGQATGNVTVSATLSGLPTASQSVQVNPGPGNRLIFVTASHTPEAGVCSPQVRVQSQDAQGNAAPVGTDTTITLAASPSTGFQFFTNPGCTGSPVSTVSLLNGQNTIGFYFKGTVAQGVNVTATSPGFTGSTQSHTIRAGPPSIVSLTGPSTATAGDCNATQLTLSLLDAYNNPTVATTNTSISLSVSSGRPLTFSRTVGCASASSTVSINQGMGSATMFFRGTEAGASTIRAVSGSLTAGTLNVTINAAAPTSIEFTTGQQRIPVGTCSAVTTVQLRDAYNNPAQAQANTEIGLLASPSDTFQFFSGTGCSGSPTSVVTIPAGGGAANFSFRGNRSGAVVMTASLGSVTRTQNANLDPGAPTALHFTPSSVSKKAGECRQVDVQSRDALGNPAPVTGNQVVALTASPSAGFGFYSNSGCSNASSNVTISNGQNTATFYVRGTTVGNVTVTGTSAFAPVTLAVTVGPEVPYKLAFKTPAQQIVKGICSAVTTVEVQDTHGNASPVAAGATVTLTSSTGNVTFHTDASCTTQAVTTVPVGANQSIASFYFKSSAYGSVTLDAASGTLIGASQVETIDPIPPTELAFTTAPSTAPAGSCAKMTVQTRENGNPTIVTSPLTVALSASPTTSFGFYTDASCNSAAGQVIIAAGGSGTADFYFKGTAAGTFGITASSGALTPATHNATIAALVASRVGFVTPSATTVAGTCSAAVTIQSVDQYGNASPVNSATTVNLTDPGDSTDNQFEFFAVPGCGGSAVTSITIPTSPSVVSFSYRPRKARNVTLTAGGNGLANGTQGHTVSPATAKKLVFKTAGQTLLAGTCALRTVESQDDYDNPAVDALTVSLSASETAEFFTAPDCNPSSLTTQVSIPAGMSTATFYFKGYKGGNNANLALALTASAPGLTDAIQSNNNITPTVRTGSCPLANNQMSIQCPISPPLADGNRMFLTFQAITQDTRSDAASVRCRVYNVNEVACDRDSTSTNPVSIHWRVAEFPNGVATHNPVVDCGGNTTTEPLAGFDSTRTFLLLSSQRKGADQSSDVPRLAELTSSTQAEIRKTGGCGSPASSDKNNLQVVGYTGASVRRGLTSLAAGQPTTTASLPAVVPGRSLLLYSYIYGGPSTQYCDRAVRGELTNATTVSFSRGEGDATSCAGVPISSISWEVVEFPAGTVVQSLTRQLVALQPTLTVTLPTSVDPSRTVIITGGQWASGQVHGEGKHTGVDGISDMRAMATLAPDGSSITLTRATSVSTATFTFFVVQLKP